jgi:GNAT superfamily N-acetyltransferase
MNAVEQHLVDAIEACGWGDCLKAAPADMGCAVLQVPGTEATLLRTTVLPIPMMNRIIGLPGDAAPSQQTLAWVAQAYRDVGIDHCWLHAWADSPLGGELEALGLHAEAGARWHKFLFDLAAAPPSAPRASVLHVRPARADESATAGAIICGVFGLPPALEPWFGAIVGRPNWQMMFACDANDRPVAAGAVYIDGGRAWLGMGTTLPEARRQGAQQLLIAARLAAAKAAGCTVAAIETGVALEGAVNHSLNNIRRAGFREVGVRVNYLLAARSEFKAANKMSMPVQ